MAVDTFHNQITAAWMEVTDLVLKLGMKSLEGVITWALLRPEQWTDIVRDGDEIRVGGSGADVTGLNDQRPLVTFQCRSRGSGEFEYTGILLPKTGKVSNLQN